MGHGVIHPFCDVPHLRLFPFFLQLPFNQIETVAHYGHSVIRLLRSYLRFTSTELPRAKYPIKKTTTYSTVPILLRLFRRLVMRLLYDRRSSPAMSCRAVSGDSGEMSPGNVKRKRYVPNSSKVIFFSRQIQLPTLEIFGHASTSQPADQPTLRSSLVCQAVHSRYRTTTASQFLSSEVRWNPPEVTGDIVCQPAWFQTPVAQLRARLARINAETTKWYCNLYLAPGLMPKSKTERYDVLVQRFRARSLHLLTHSTIDFAREYLALLPRIFCSLPCHDTSVWKPS